ncbi:MAG: hypothetical protein QM704_18805 [Anaeromyxobacteraceae bacterium]
MDRKASASRPTSSPLRWVTSAVTSPRAMRSAAPAISSTGRAMWSAARRATEAAAPRSASVTSNTARPPRSSVRCIPAEASSASARERSARITKSQGSKYATAPRRASTAPPFPAACRSKRARAVPSRAFAASRRPGSQGFPVASGSSRNVLPSSAASGPMRSFPRCAPEAP